MTRKRFCTIAFTLASLIVLVGCGEPKRHVVANATSPDGRFVAIVEEEEPTPLVETDTLVFVMPVGRAKEGHSDLIFRGADMNGKHFGPVNVHWSDKFNLEVGYCTGRMTAFRNGWSDALNPNLPEIFVHLVEEPEGEWPANVPVARRAGAPPCR